MSGAETFRVEESISRVLAAYGLEAEVFAIPNYLIVSILTEDGTPITRMRRIGPHGNDLDAVEKYNGLSRAYCNRRPEPKVGTQWLDVVRGKLVKYPVSIECLGDFIGAGGFSLIFGASWIDAICSGVCGILVGFVSRLFERQNANPFFRTIATSFFMALAAYAMGAAGIAPNPDAVTIGALMLLVPGLLFTNAMRDIIYGDTNSGINRIVQVMLTALAIALGTAVAWRLAGQLWGLPQPVLPLFTPSRPIVCLPLPPAWALPFFSTSTAPAESSVPSAECCPGQSISSSCGRATATFSPISGPPCLPLFIRRPWPEFGNIRPFPILLWRFSP